MKKTKNEENSLSRNLLIFFILIVSLSLLYRVDYFGSITGASIGLQDEIEIEPVLDPVVTEPEISLPVEPVIDPVITEPEISLPVEPVIEPVIAEPEISLPVEHVLDPVVTEPEIDLPARSGGSEKVGLPLEPVEDVINNSLVVLLPETVLKKNQTTGTSLSGQEITLSSSSLLWTLDFESNGGYNVTMTEFSDLVEDYYGRAEWNGGDPNIVGVSGNFSLDIDGPLPTAMVNGEYFFAAMDIDAACEAGSGCGPLPVNMTSDSFSISGYNNLLFTVSVAEGDDGVNQDWDEPDFVHFYYSIDNGAWQNLLWFENDGSALNSAPFQDTDFDGTGDGTEVTNSFSRFNVSIASTGENMRIRVSANLDAGDEDIHLDHFNVTGDATVNNKPVVESIILNTTDLTLNGTNQNLTAYVNLSDTDNNTPVKPIYNWLLNGTSIAVLNMPFERVNETNESNAYDYSGYGNIGTITNEVNNATFNATGGYDGKGAYEFDGINDAITLTSLPLVTESNVTVDFWMYWKEGGGSGGFSMPFGFPNYDLIFQSSTNSFGFNTANSDVWGIVDTGLANRWVHVAATFVQNNFSNSELYVDGIKQTLTQRMGTSVNTRTVSNSASISGWTSDGNYKFNGSIDEVMIWNRTLSASQIWALFSNKSNVISSDETTTGQNWTVDITPNDGSEDGAVVRSNQLIVLSNIKPTVDSLILNTTDLSLNGTNQNLTAYVNLSDTDNNTPVKPIYNWLLNGTSIAVLNMPFEKVNGSDISNTIDYSGYGNEGLITDEANNATWNSSGGYDGKGAYEFDGINDAITFTSLPLVTESNVTVDFWMYWKGGGGSGGFSMPFGFPNYDLIFESSTNSFGFNTANSDVWGIVDTGLANRWVHVAATFVQNNFSNSELYVDGIKQTLTQRKATSVNTRTVNNSASISGWTSDGNYKFNGSIDEVMIWNRTLSASQIWALYTNQSNVISSNETTSGQNWTVDVTPNDGSEDGARVRSNQLIVLGVIEDTTAPLVLVTLPQNNTRYLNTTIPVTFVASDANLDSCWFDIQNGTNVTIANCANFSINPGRGNPFRIQIFANDSSNNINATTAWINFSVNELPIIQSLLLNTTDLTLNGTNQNITANVSVTDTDNTSSIKLIYNWLVNDSSSQGPGRSITLLNMPFERVNGTNTSNALDYSGYGNDGTITDEANNATWNSTGGYDGKGAYEFDGVNDYIDMGSFDMGNNFSIVLWTRTLNTVADSTIIGKHDSSGGNQILLGYYSSSYHFRINSDFLGGPAPISGWQHLAVVGFENPNSSTTVTLYQNATLLAEGVINDTVGNISGGRGWVLGQDWDPGGSSDFYNGTIDEVMIFNRTLSASQIHALFNNRTDLISFNETTSGQNWTVDVTPNDGFENGNVTRSNQLIVLGVTAVANNKPVVESIILNATDLTLNGTNQNLTAYVNLSDTDNNTPVKAIYNWLLNGTSIAVLNMPFEAVNGTNESNAYDYSGYGNGGTITDEANNATFNATGGYDGKGAYEFDGINDVMAISSDPSFLLASNRTISTWVKVDGTGKNRGIITTRPVSGSEGYVMRIDSSDQLDLFHTGGGQIININFSLYQGKWTHLVWTASSDTGFDIYINGVLNSSDITATDNAAFNSNDLFLGLENAASSPFNGSIDELMIFNRSLSASQVHALFINQSNVISSDETTSGQNWTVDVTPNDGSEDGNRTRSNQLIILGNVKPIVQSIILNTTDLTLNGTNQNLTAYVNLSDTDNNTPVKAIYNWLVNGTPIAVLNVPFEGVNGTTTDNAYDYSGYGNGGTITDEANNATWNATGGYDGKGAYEFDGINDVITISSDPSFLLASNRTISTWVKVDGTGKNRGIITTRPASASEGYVMRIDSSDQLDLFHTGGGQIININFSLYQGKWTHLVWTASSDTGFDIYINGVLNSSDITATDNAAFNSNDLFLGLENAASSPFNGSIDELMIFNRSLSASQVYALFNNRTDLISSDETTSGQNWTVDVTPNDGNEDGSLVRSNQLITLGATADTTAPLLTVTSPENNTRFLNTTIPVTFVASDETALDTCWFDIQNGTNVTIANCANFSLSPGRGQFRLQLFANDSSNNINATTAWINFSVNVLPSVTSLILNSTDLTLNGTNENLTAYVQATDTDNSSAVKHIYNWLLNGTPIAVLNMPFERINGTNTSNALDYSGYGNDGTIANEANNATWNGSGGYDGKGAYMFNRTTGHYIHVTEAAGFDFESQRDNYSIEMRVKLKTNDTTQELMIKRTTGTYPFTIRTDSSGNLLMAIYDGSVAIESQFVADPQNDVWYHLVGVVDSNNTLSAYADGVLKTVSDISTLGPTANNVDLFIGSRYDGSFPFNGTIDELRIYNRSLTTQQVKALFENRTDLIVFNETTSGQNWTVDVTPNDGSEDGNVSRSNQLIILGTPADITAPLLSVTSPVNNTRFLNTTIPVTFVASDETALDTCWFDIQNGTNVTIANCANFSLSPGRGQFRLQLFANDSSNNINATTAWINFSVNVLPSVTSLILNTTDLTLNGTNENLTAYVQATDTDNSSAIKHIYNWLLNGTSIAVLNMPFERVNGTNSSNAWDYSGFGHNGSDNGSLIWNGSGGYDGKGAYQFDGIDDLIMLGSLNNGSVFRQTHAITYTFWTKIPSAGGGYVMGAGAAGGHGFGGVDLTTTDVLFRWTPTDPGLDTVIQNNSGLSLPIDKWFHVAFAVDFDNRNASLYINGTRQNVIYTRNSTNWHPVTSYSDGENDTIGGRFVNSQLYFNGSIDDIIIFNRSLSQDQVKALYNNGTDMIVWNETTSGENWTVDVTPNDGSEDGNVSRSNQLIVLGTPADITAPLLSVTSPVNNTRFLNTTIPVTFVASDETALDTCWFDIQNGTNVTIANCANFSLSPGRGQFRLQLFANDTSNNINATTAWINFSVNVLPSVTSLILNTTDLTLNGTNQNLTAYVQATDTDNSSAIKHIYNWLLNGTSIAVLNLPFERVNGTNMTNAYDYSGYGTIVAINGSPNWTATGGYDGKGAYEFNGSTDYINISLQNHLNITREVTVSAWIKVKSLKVSGIAGHWRIPEYPFLLWMNGPGNISFVVNNSNYVYTRIPDLDKWYHVAGVYNGTNVSIYMNGTLVHSKSQTGNIAHNGFEYLIGVYSNDGSTYNFFNGTIDDVIIFNKSLSSSQIWNLYNNRTDLISSDEITSGQNWTVDVTPNDGSEDGNASRSNQLITLGVTADTTAPLLSVISPENNTRFLNTTIPVTFVASDETALDTCWFDIQNGTNVTIANCANFSLSPGRGQFRLQLFANDSSNNINATTAWINFSVNVLPSVTSLILNTTDLTLNGTNENLTAYVQATDTDNSSAVKHIYNWLLNGTPIAVLNMPFERVNGTNTSNAYDYSGYGNDGTIVNEANNATWNATGGYGGKGAYKFDGINDFISLPDNFIDYQTSGTIAGWVKGAGGELFSYGDEDGTNNFLLVRMNTQPVFWIREASGDNEIILTSDVSIGGASWTHIAITQNGSNITMYINGSVISYTLTESSGTADHNSWFDDIGSNAENGCIGALCRSTVSSLATTTIDDFMIFNRSLSASQIWALYSNQSNVISSDEMTSGQNWTVDVTPNDGNEDGSLVRSNQLITLGATADTTAPLLSVISPVNNTRFLNTTIPVTFVASDETALDTCWFDIQNGTNVTIANCANFSLSPGRGQFRLQLFANDTSNNINATTAWINFSVNVLSSVTSLILNTTDLTLNGTNENLTAYVQATDTDNSSAVKHIYNWLLNGTPIAVLNMPFERVNGTNTSNALDYSGYGNDGTDSGVIWNATGGYDGKGAYEFNGNGSSRINLSALGIFEFQNVTFTAWVKINQLKYTESEGGIFLSRYLNNGGENQGYYWGMNTQGRLRFAFWDTNPTFRSLTSSSSSNLTNRTGFVFIASTFNHTNIVNYIDGIQDGLLDIGSGQIIRHADTNLLMGEFSENSFSGEFNGTIDEVLIFNRSLSASQIWALYTNQSNVISSDETTSGQNWTVDVTPNDGSEDGNVTRSNQLIVTDAVLDNIAPTVIWQTPTNVSNYTLSTFNITFNVSVLELNIEQVIFQFDNASGTDFNISLNNGSGHWSNQYNVSSLAEGTHTVRVVANDTNGNINSTEELTFIVDNIAPTVTWINSNVSNYTKSTYNITFNVSVSELNYAQSVLFSFDNASGTAFNVTAVNGSGHWSNQYNVSSLAEGTHVVTVIANDSAGNINNSEQITFITDYTAPTVTWVNPSNNSNYTKSTYNITFNVSITELNYVKSVLFSFDNASGTAFNVTAINGSGHWSNQYNVSSLAEGTHTVTVIANDTNNNLNNTEQITFIVDNTAPNVTWINSNVSNYTISSYNITFNVSITELNYVKQVLFSFDNSSGTAFNITAVNGSGHWSNQYNVSSLAEGTHTVTVIANDSAGNINSTKELTFIVDYTAPTVNFVNTQGKNHSQTTYNITFNVSILELNYVQSVLFSFDNSSGTPFNVTAVNGSGHWSNQYNVSSLAEGYHVMTVLANDSAGNVNDTQKLNFTVDFTAPTASFITPTNLSNYSISSFNQTFNVSVQDLTAQSVLFSFDNSSGTSFNITAVNQSGYWSNQYNVSSLSEGVHLVTVIINDSLGNYNRSQQRTFTVDFTAPVVNFISPSDESNFTISSGNESFLADISDLTIQTVLFSFDNATGTGFNATAINDSGQWSVNYNVSTLSEGRHTITVIANDSLGNVDNSASITITVDSTPPELTWITLSGRNYSLSSYNQTFNVSVLDRNLSVQYVLFSFDNASGTAFNITALNGSGHWANQYNVSSLAEGSHVVTAIANDTNNNLNNTELITFIVDNTAPSVTITAPLNQRNYTVASSNQTFNVTVRDTNLFVQSVQLSFDNATGNAFNVTAVNNSGIWNVSYNVSSLIEGKHTVTVIANDTNNNRNNTVNVTFILDSTAPEVTITLPLAGADFTSGNVNVEATVNDRNLSVQSVIFSFDDAGGTPFNQTATNSSGTWSASVAHSSFTLGTHIMTVLANDTNGNANNTQTVSFTVSAAAVSAPSPSGGGGGGGGGSSAGTAQAAKIIECTQNSDCPTDKYCVSNQCLKIFDLKTIRVDSPIQPGEIFDFTYFIKGMADISGDVDVRFWIEKNGERIVYGNDVIFVGIFEEKIEQASLSLPTSLAPGQYDFVVKLVYDSYEITSQRSIEVKPKVEFALDIAVVKPEIKLNEEWELTTVISSNKDESLSGKLTRRIKKGNSEVWFKETDIFIERSVKIADIVPALKSGDYELEIIIEAEGKISTHREKFRIGPEIQLPSSRTILIAIISIISMILVGLVFYIHKISLHKYTQRSTQELDQRNKWLYDSHLRQEQLRQKIKKLERIRNVTEKLKKKANKTYMDRLTLLVNSSSEKIKKAKDELNKFS